MYLGYIHRKIWHLSYGSAVRIGETLQRNPWTEDWVDFFREQRLRFQVLAWVVSLICISSFCLSQITAKIGSNKQGETVLLGLYAGLIDEI